MAIPLPSLQASLLSRTTTDAKPTHFPVSFRKTKRALVGCSAKKKISFVDQILDYIEGGPKLRKWYGAPELLPKDGSSADEDDDYSEEDEVRDAILVTDGDSDIGQMVILSLIVKRARVKALVNDKRVASEAFGDYVEEGFLSSISSLKGIKHVILLSQLSVYKGTGGIQALMKGNTVKLAEQDESKLLASGIPCTIIRAGTLQDAPGGQQGFCFDEGSAVKGSLSNEDAALICVEAINVVPQAGFIFEVVNGDEKVSDWKERLSQLMERAGPKLL
ncbi:uncharacterized protein LOC116210230 isoform X2 [Punica granatum]|uniref:Uncharacterized protein LOC116210230 isoform X2 n=1 Tax=Punica granatum TaxID=22663 RepID=A0A6P8DW16_PUNGR|nr:uncharacterized protein LOC116210230 isoform X2 [Punica granatum]